MTDDLLTAAPVPGTPRPGARRSTWALVQVLVVGVTAALLAVPLVGVTLGTLFVGWPATLVLLGVVVLGVHALGAATHRGSPLTRDAAPLLVRCVAEGPDGWDLSWWDGHEAVAAHDDVWVHARASLATTGRPCGRRSPTPAACPRTGCSRCSRRCRGRHGSRRRDRDTPVRGRGAWQRTRWTTPREGAA